MEDDDCMCLVCPSSTADSTDDAEPPDSGRSTGEARRTRGFSVRIHGKVQLHSADLINSTVTVLTAVQCMIVSILQSAAGREAESERFEEPAGEMCSY